MRRVIDLHLHSTASDGSLPPRRLMEEAAKAGVSVVALTDHDSTGGIPEASATAASLSMDFIPGIELGCSTEYGQVDILGYYVPLGNSHFEGRLKELRIAREQRNSIILSRLAELGFPISLEELSAMGECAIGRPHIASLMLRKGYVQSVREAFDRYLGAGKPAYEPKKSFAPAEAVEFLASVGAVPVIAHPMLIRAPWDWLVELTQHLVPYGLAGLEAYHSEHNAKGVRNIVALADRHNLIVTGGSDFHGDAKPHIAIGRGKGGLVVPETVLRGLEERHSQLVSGS